MPEAFFKRLNPGGRLFAVVGEGAIMSARLVTATAAGIFHTDSLFETRVKALANALEPARFSF
jgi:protein-L-isoaspartate(D-aspartate) O-methyltransferase